MSRDKPKGPVRRPRTLRRAATVPGPLQDLKDLLYQVYLAADAPSLDDIAADIAAAEADDHALAGAPSRDTIHRCISAADAPAKQADVVAVAIVLARRAAWDEDHIAGRVRSLWVDAQISQPVGIPIREISDPFALEVHRAIEVLRQGDTATPLLPTYVERSHDQKVQQLVSEALDGKSKLAVLVGDSSSGKTRSCWEAVQKLPDDWRLWHPIDPSHPSDLLNNLNSVGRRTVIWLNEVQHYLLTTPGDLGERVAAGLRALMRDATRAPILLLATAWPEHWDVLVTVPEQSNFADPHSQARALLTGNDITVASQFTGSDVDGLAKAASSDARIQFAMDHAEQGQITQYLAGGPALVERYRNAPAAARAIITAAIDIRRLGHDNSIPHSLIEVTAENYLTDQQWDQLDDSWLEEALSYVTRPLRGARGPLTRIRPRPGKPGPATPRYRLADYLEQYGRDERQNVDVPQNLWGLLVDYAEASSCVTLAEAAIKRNFYRVALQLCDRAASAGIPQGLTVAARALWKCARVDEALAWYLEAVARGVTGAINEAANSLWSSGYRSRALTWLEDAASNGDTTPLVYAGDVLWRDRRVADSIKWYRKAAASGNESAHSLLEFVDAEPVRIKEALAELDRRAEDGDVNALSLAGKLLEEAGFWRGAFNYYKAAAQAGDISAEHWLTHLGWREYEEDDKVKPPKNPPDLPEGAIRHMPPKGQYYRYARAMEYGLEPDGSPSRPWTAEPPIG